MTRLLFITQKMDKDDDLLGVYHQWVAKLAEKVEKISVICLYRGRLELPANVNVFSLGKENGVSRLKYLFNFYRYLWILRRDYNTVFVHMNPEYVILGAKFWKLFGKKIFFWYNHPLGGIRARFAIALSNVVFHTSPLAFAARYKKARQMPVGIDTDLFHRLTVTSKKPNSILYVGRISPIKKLELLLDAANILLTENLDFSLTIAGEPSKPSEIAYAEKIKNKAQSLMAQGRIEFIRSVPNHKTPELYNHHELSVNMTPSGSFDKTIIESMACETPVITSNQALRDVLPKELIFEEGKASELANKIKYLLKLDPSEREKIGRKIREIVVQNHCLDFLIKRIIYLFGRN